MKKLIIVLSMLLVVISCGEKLSSDDPVVMDIVLELVKEHLMDQSVPLLMQQELSIDHSVWGYPSYDILKEDIENESAQYIVSLIDEKIGSIMLILNSTRTIEQDKKLNKITCGAVVGAITNANPDNWEETDLFDIIYTTQLTDDSKKVFVEILEITEK